MKKRFSVALLVLVLAFMVAQSAFAMENDDFVIQNGTLIMYNGDGGNVVIPDDVTAIGNDAFKDCGGLIGAAIPNSVTTIGEGAFFFCVNMKNVTIPDSVTDIGAYAFGYWFNEDAGGPEKVSDFTIYGKVGSFAEVYAKDYELRFVALPLIAKPTASNILVDGKSVAFDAYNIGGNNYFKLRDLAYTLSGTEKRFEVDWDGVNIAIVLTSGKPYTSVGGEMTGKGAGDKTPLPTTSKITLNGKNVNFTAYNIDDNNYFKLRDIGQAFDFGVDWDGANNTIIIDTSKGYTVD
jgi:hypothetical protein